jgi:hypothetical protein
MSTSLVVRIVFWIWLLAAVAAGNSQSLQRLPPIATPGILFGLTALLVLAYRAIGAFRTWVDAIDLRALLLLHVTRFVGIYFLVLHQRGQLPAAFALPAGFGDIAVAMLALVVAFFPFADATRLRATYLWNVIGFVDLLLVVFSAARIVLSGSRELFPLTQLPLSLLPTFLVPLLLASHLAIFARLSRERDTP